MYPYSLFITLTWNDSNVPINEWGVPTLVTDEMKNFRRRLCRNKEFPYSENSLRWYGVGEYGKDEFHDNKLPTEEKYEASNIKAYGRPHYHMVLFGCGAESEPLVEKAWNSGEDVHEFEGRVTRGFVQTGLLNADRAAYIAQYTTKKMTSAGDDRLMHRYPEFQRSSRMGLMRGIGFPAVGWLATEMGSATALKELKKYGDVFSTVRIDGRVYPLGRYMRAQLRDALGLSQKSEERWHQLGRIKSKTGEIVPPDPLPEYYGPWKDAMQQKFPLQLRHGQEKADIDLYFAHKQSEKRERQIRKTGTEVV